MAERMIPGGAAFPRPTTPAPGPDDHPPQPGLSKREWVAEKALTGVLAGWPAHTPIDVELAAQIAWDAADALIEELRK